MDKHYLTPLFSPQSVLVFAGNQEDAAAAFAQAKALYANLTAQRFNGEIRFVDIQTTGTLADLALARAALAIIADRLIDRTHEMGRLSDGLPGSRDETDEGAADGHASPPRARHPRKVRVLPRSRDFH